MLFIQWGVGVVLDFAPQHISKPVSRHACGTLAEREAQNSCRRSNGPTFQLATRRREAFGQRCKFKTGKPVLCLPSRRQKIFHSELELRHVFVARSALVSDETSRNAVLARVTAGYFYFARFFCHALSVFIDYTPTKTSVEMNYCNSRTVFSLQALR